MYYGGNRFLTKLLRIVFSTFDVLVNFVCSLLYRTQRNQLPAINNELLLEPVIVLAAKIRKGLIKSEDVVSAYIKRIKDVQPFINAIVDERFLLALREAQKADAYIRTSGKTEKELMQEKPLLGVPFSCKSSIALQGMTWESGQVARKGLRAEEDAEVVKLIRESGAIPLGTTNVPEVCFSIDTYNHIYGGTRNPYDLSRSAGGSSGGEAALISAAASVAGVGNDMCGSLRIPACFTGIYAHKPSAGIVANGGVYPVIEKGMDDYCVQGPMCRYADDLMPLLKVMAGSRQGLLRLDTKVQMRQLTIYYTEEDSPDPTLGPVSPDVRLAIRKAVHYFKKTYDVNVQKISIPNLRHTYFVSGISLRDSNSRDVVDVIGESSGKKIHLTLEFLKSLLGLSDHTATALWFAVFSRLLPTQPHIVDQYTNHKKELQKEFDDLLKENCVFLYPTTREGAIYPAEALHKLPIIVRNTLFNTLGLPVTQCPLGLNKEGLPIGVQIVGGRYQDHLTISVGRELERAFGGWQCPCPTLVKPVMQ